MILIAFEGNLSASHCQSMVQTPTHSLRWPPTSHFHNPQEEIARRSELLDEFVTSGAYSAGIVYVWNYVTDIIQSVAQNRGNVKDLVATTAPERIWWPQLICLHHEDWLYSLIITEMFPSSEILFISDPAELYNNYLYMETA